MKDTKELVPRIAYETDERIAILEKQVAGLVTALELAAEAIAYASHDDSVGYRVCCQVASYKPHTKTCYLQAALAMVKQP